MSESEYETTDAPLTDRIAWLAIVLAAVALPFVGLALDAPWYWWMVTPIWLYLVQQEIARDE